MVKAATITEIFTNSLKHQEPPLLPSPATMITFCVFRRYGIAVPVVVFVVGLLLQTILDHKYGSGYYSSHFWSTGLSLFLSGVILTTMAYLLDDEKTYGQSEYTLVKGDVEVARDCVESFINSPSQADMFCYIPFNYCARAITGVGILVMLLQLFPFK
jgi:hypothetical protein